MPFAATVALATLLWKFIDTLKAAKSKDWNLVVTQAIVWVSGIVVVLLFAHSDFANLVPIGDAGMTLATLSLTSQVIIGLLVASLTSVGVDIKKSVDNTDSSKQNSFLK